MAKLLGYAQGVDTIIKELHAANEAFPKLRVKRHRFLRDDNGLLKCAQFDNAPRRFSRPEKVFGARSSVGHRVQ